MSRPGATRKAAHHGGSTKRPQPPANPETWYNLEHEDPNAAFKVAIGGD